MFVWDIEKIFHQLKSKKHKRKSWGSGTEANQSHATFECLTRNLLLLCIVLYCWGRDTRSDTRSKKRDFGDEAEVKLQLRRRAAVPTRLIR